MFDQIATVYQLHQTWIVKAVTLANQHMFHQIAISYQFHQTWIVKTVTLANIPSTQL